MCGVRRLKFTPLHSHPRKLPASVRVLGEATGLWLVEARRWFSCVSTTATESHGNLCDFRSFSWIQNQTFSLAHCGKSMLLSDFHWLGANSIQFPISWLSLCTSPDTPAASSISPFVQDGQFEVRLDKRSRMPKIMEKELISPLLCACIEKESATSTQCPCNPGCHSVGFSTWFQ